MLLWLRDETKKFEKRVALTPVGAKKLLDLGVNIIVEKSKNRTFSDREYIDAGCELVPSGSWKEAPSEAIILGLKELEDESFPLIHKHIYFAHCFKGQDGAKKILERFRSGGGELYDLEFLVDENQRRVAAFGYWAGFVGAALALKILSYKEQNKPLESPLKAYKDKDELISDIKSDIKCMSYSPLAIVIGAKGRCGKGAVELFEECELEVSKWDLEETKAGGPFKAILEHHILANCVLVSNPMPPFINHELLKNNSKLKVITDISCDPTGDYNPIPLYNDSTTLCDPTVRIPSSIGEIDIQAVDHLPTLLPRESSEEFAEDLFSHLIDFLTKEKMSAPVWKRARELFLTHLNQ